MASPRSSVAHNKKLWQREWGRVFFQNPRRYLGLLGLIVGIFLVLGFLFNMVMHKENQTIPFIQGCPGPIRIRPPTPTDKKPQHRIYADLSTRAPPHTTRSHTAESLLPPLEQPVLTEEESEHRETVLKGDTISAAPLPSSSAASPASSPPSSSLDDLLKQIDEVIVHAPPAPQRKPERALVQKKKEVKKKKK